MDAGVSCMLSGGTCNYNRDGAGQAMIPSAQVDQIVSYNAHRDDRQVSSRECPPYSELYVFRHAIVR